MSAIYVVGIDNSDGSVRAAQYAVDHAAMTGASVRVVHILEWSPYAFLTNEELEERHMRRRQELERAREAITDLLVNKLSVGSVTVEQEVRYGHIAEEMKKYCEEIGASHVYLGRHGGSTLETRLFGSVPGALVQLSTIPVTIVP